jgi:hypothetical protein
MPQLHRIHKGLLDAVENDAAEYHHHDHEAKAVQQVKGKDEG